MSKPLPSAQKAAVPIQKASPGADGKTMATWLRVAGITASVLIAALIGLIAVAALNGFDYNADAMYLPALYHDLLSGESLRNWGLPSVAGFIPDMPLMFGLMALTGGNIPLSFVVYGVLIMLLLAGAILFLLDGLLRPRWWNAPVVLAVLLLWMLILMAGNDGAFLLRFVLMPSFHSGAMVLGIFFLACTLRMFRLQPSKAMTFAWIVLAAGSTVSDPFFVLQFLAPVLLCLIVFHRRPTFPEGLSFARTVLMGGSAALLASAMLVGGGRLVHLGGESVGKVMLQVNNFSPLLAWAYAAYRPLIEQNLSIFIFSGACLTAAAAILIRLGRRACYISADRKPPQADGDRHRLLFCMSCFLVSVAVTLMFCLLNVAYPLTTSASIRYFQPLYCAFPVIVLTTWVLLQASSNARKLILIMPAILVACAFFTIMGRSSFLPNRLYPARPAFVKFFDDLKEDTSCTNGLGSYWLAKPTNLLSESGVWIDPILFPRLVYPHIGNGDWYLIRDQDGRNRLRKYDFIVPYDMFSTEMILSRFGQPAGIYKQTAGISKPNAAIFEGPVIRAMIYNRKSDLAFRNYLYSTVLEMTGRELPSHVKSPSKLQQVKKDGVPLDPGDCCMLSPGQQLEVLFDPPATGDVLELSADADDEYEIVVRYVNGGTETLKAPARNGRGLWRHFLPLSSTNGIPTVRSLLIRPVSGNEPYGIGQVLIYKDNW